MPFCKFTANYVDAEKICIDAGFFNNYLPHANETCLKVYLLGLFNCHNSASADNTLTHFSAITNLSTEDIESAFLYWQDEGLVQVLNTDPFEVRYLPVKTAVKKGIGEKLNTTKYKSFNIEVQEILTGRMILPSEFNRYYEFIEDNSVEPAALVMLIKHCVLMKNDDISQNYILKIAKNWANQGIKTVEKVEEKIKSQNILYDENAKVAKALKFGGTLSLEHQQVYSKWFNELGFNPGTILYVAKEISKLNTKNKYEKLDAALLNYYEKKLMSIPEIEQYENDKQNTFKLALSLNKALGLYYENMDNEIETYILPWKQKGYDEPTLLHIANYCFKSNIRTLGGMDNVISKFYKLGLLTITAINSHIDEVTDKDAEIKNIIGIIGLDRRINNFDRENYKTWCTVWNISPPLIEYAAKLACGKSMQYLNQILAGFYQNKITTVEQAQKQKPAAGSPQNKKSAKTLNTRSYTSEELNALFDNLDEIKI